MPKCQNAKMSKALQCAVLFVNRKQFVSKSWYYRKGNLLRLNWPANSNNLIWWRISFSVWGWYDLILEKASEEAPNEEMNSHVMQCTWIDCLAVWQTYAYAGREMCIYIHIYTWIEMLNIGACPKANSSTSHPDIYLRLKKHVYIWWVTGWRDDWVKREEWE